MENKRQYLQIMIESLQKKESVLREIMMANDEQTAILNQDTMDWDAFDQNAEHKVKLIERLNYLDEGFESLYNNIQDALSDEAQRKMSREEIKQMQSLISLLTEKSMSIQAAEARNKQLVEAKFAVQRRQIRSGRASSKAAMGYYQNMRQTSAMQSQFLDSKK